MSPGGFSSVSCNSPSSRTQATALPQLSSTGGTPSYQLDHIRCTSHPPASSGSSASRNLRSSVPCFLPLLFKPTAQSNKDHAAAAAAANPKPVLPCDKPTLTVWGERERSNYLLQACSGLQNQKKWAVLGGYERRCGEPLQVLGRSLSA